MGKEGEESSRNMYKGPIDKAMDEAKGGRIEGGRWGVGGVGWSHRGENGDNCT